MTYTCPVCGNWIASWIAKKEHFECPHCQQLLTSNIQQRFKQSLIVALCCWLVFLIILQQYSGSWGFAAAVSLEGGGMLSAAVAALYYRCTVKIGILD